MVILAAVLKRGRGKREGQEEEEEALVE